MPKLVCVSCEKEYKVVKSGNIVVDMFLDPPQPYRIQNGDRWQCPDCGHQVIAGFAEVPLSEHYRDDFSKLLERVKAQDTTIYCYE